MEILAPAGSFACVAAAAQNGADAIYLGYGSFHARQNAVGFTREELQTAVAYCRVRGIKVYVTLNTLLTDRELEEGASLVTELAGLGINAILVQDLGVLRMARAMAPALEVHASTQMSVHSLDGVRQAHALGCSRVVLARELTRVQIAYICKHAPIPVEVFVHGALCLSHSGQCYMSGIIGERSGNRGLCAGACRLPYGFEDRADEYPLSMRDLSLTSHLNELRDLGVASVKIEGRMKRPEYVALTTRVVSDALTENRQPTPEELQALGRVFSRQGFTEGYYTGELGRSMFGVRVPDADGDQKLFTRVRATYEGNVERQRVPVHFACLMTAGRPSLLGVEDEQGNKVTVHGLVPNPAFDHTLPEAMVNTQLYKTGGTPYLCVEARTQIDDGLSLPLSAINAMRRESLDALTEKRRRIVAVQTAPFKAGLKYLARKEPPALTVQVARASQITPELLALAPHLIYVPLWELATHKGTLSGYLRAGAPLVAVLPRVIGDHEGREVKAMLDEAASMGISEALVGNIGQFAMVRARKWKLRGDFGLNVFNSQALKTLKQAELISATLSFELNLAQVRDLSHCMDTELIVYGRLPLMLSENCLIKNRAGRCACDNLNELTDRTGSHFPVLREYKCRNVIYNAHKLFLADREESYRRVGLWAARLLFTTENPRECVQVLERYMGRGSYEPNGYTRGLYFRSVR